MNSHCAMHGQPWDITPPVHATGKDPKSNLKLIQANQNFVLLTYCEKSQKNKNLELRYIFNYQNIVVPMKNFNK